METKSLSELLPQVLEAFNQETLEYNAVCVQADSLEVRNIALYSENDQLKTQLDKAKQDNACILERLQKLLNDTESVQKNAEMHMNLVKQAKREQDQAQDKLDQATALLAGYKQLGTPKKLREQIKNYKEKAATSLKTITSLKSQVKTYRTELDTEKKVNNTLYATKAQESITNIWSANSEHLFIFPAPLTMLVNGKEEKQLTLLYMDGSGCGKLLGLSEESEAVGCVVPKEGLNPSEVAMDKAGSILRKFKKRNWKPTHQDLLDARDD